MAYKILLLIGKDLKVELGSFRMSTVLLAISLLISTVVSAGLTISSLPRDEVMSLVPVFLWVIFLMVSSISLNEFNNHENEEDAFSALLLSGVTATEMFISKICSQTLILLPVHILAAFIFSVFMNFPLLGYLHFFTVISLLVLIGFNSLSVLFLRITSNERLSSPFLPILMLPFLFPLYFAASQLTFELYIYNRFSWDSIWLSLLVGMDIIYVAFGTTLYEFIIRR